MEYVQKANNNKIETSNVSNDTNDLQQMSFKSVKSVLSSTANFIQGCPEDHLNTEKREESESERLVFCFSLNVYSGVQTEHEFRIIFFQCKWNFESISYFLKANFSGTNTTHQLQHKTRLKE